jgi:hypothetical protein
MDRPFGEQSVRRTDHWNEVPERRVWFWLIVPLCVAYIALTLWNAIRSHHIAATDPLTVIALSYLGFRSYLDYRRAKSTHSDHL